MNLDNKYQLLLNTLDAIIKEAPPCLKKYDITDDDKTDQARSRALIHLFLRTRFGLICFDVAEKLITDDDGDGGLDAYYIDKENKKIYLIQSKFGAREDNFERKKVDGYDLFKMELDLIITGSEVDCRGIKFNGKILGLQRAIREINDTIGKYKFCLVFLGNIPSNLDPQKINKVSGGVCDEVEIINGPEMYIKLLFPYLQSDFYNKKELVLKIKTNQDKSNRIDYSVQINGQAVDINLSFIPTIEVAKMMWDYKNSLLKFNPRCYAGIMSGGVNQQIEKSISKTESNEFSLLNNGITIICNDFKYSNKNAYSNSATLLITNPQIVNGGQTAYTLAKIYSEKDQLLFINKEVLVKFITLNHKHSHEQDLLIEKISEATNNQTPVKLADRKSNDDKLVDLQKYLFESHGLLLERKRGEFYNAVNNNIILKKSILSKEEVMRLIFAMKGMASEARSLGGETLFKRYPLEEIESSSYLDIYNIIEISKFVFNLENKVKNSDERYRIVEFGYGLRYGKYAIITVAYSLFKKGIVDIEKLLDEVKLKWIGFEMAIQNETSNKDYFSDGFDYDNYYKGKTINKDLMEYFK